MFGSIAHRYDLANHLLSGGMDFLWRRKAVQIVRKWNPSTLLDVATGSGDLAIALQNALPAAKVTGSDFCEPMLARATAKGLKHTLVADGMNLPFENGRFDVLTVAFGLRNMESWDGALKEFARVLRPSGHLLVLDFSTPPPPFRGIYRFYLHHILPRLASLLTGRKSAYEYLGASIEQFPQGEKMIALLNGAGFSSTQAHPLTFGVVTIHTAAKAGA